MDVPKLLSLDPVARLAQVYNVYMYMGIHDAWLAVIAKWVESDPSDNFPWPDDHAYLRLG